MSENGKRVDGFTWFLAAATAVLAVLVLLLARQNRALKAELSAAASGIPAHALHAGETLAPFDVKDAAGNTTRLAFDGGKTLLLVFSTTCGACQETLPVWNSLLREAAPGAVHVIGIQTDFSTDPAKGGALSPDLPFPIFGAAEPMGESMRKFPSIPAAALIDGSGSVTAVWFGVPGDAQLSEMRRALAG